MDFTYWLFWHIATPFSVSTLVRLFSPPLTPHLTVKSKAQQQGQKLTMTPQELHCLPKKTVNQLKFCRELYVLNNDYSLVS